MFKPEEIKYIAALSRIHLSEAEVKEFSQTLSGILDYVDQLKKVNVEGVAATSHVLPLKNVFREDTVKPSLAQAEALKIAIEHKDGSFKVPQVIE